MRKKVIRKKEPNLIPMINIIFLLLIFFMLTGVIQKKNIVKIERPSSSNSKKAESSLNQNNVIFVLTNNEKIFYEDNVINEIKFEEIIKLTQKNSKIIFEIDKETKVNKINKILKILKKNDKKKIYIRSVLNDEI